MCIVSMVHDFDPWIGPQAPIEPEAAKKVDVLTRQPGCEDPAKATLVERVAQLEKRIAELERQVNG